MILEQGLREYLLEVAPIAALIRDRLFNMVRSPQSALPAVVIQRINTIRQVLFCGTDDLVNADMQLDCYAISPQDAWGLAAAVRAALVDFTGTMGDPAGVYVDQVTLTNERPLTDPDPGIIRVIQLYNFWYLEA